MTNFPLRPLALAGFILLAVSACANSSISPAADAAPATGVDLGPSSRVPRTQLAMPAPATRHIAV